MLSLISLAKKKTRQRKNSGNAFLFFVTFFPKLAFFFFFFENKLLKVTRSHCYKPTMFESCTRGRRQRETTLSIGSRYLKSRGRGQLPKKRSRLFSENERPKALSASAADTGRAAPVGIWSQTNGKIMGRPTTHSYTEQKK